MNGGFDQAARQGLVSGLTERFQDWIEQALAVEEPPPGLAQQVWGALEADAAQGPAGVPDRYQLFAALTALVQEVKLQGRAFQRLADVLASRGEAGAGGGPGDGDRGRGLGEVLDVLLDARDSLVRGRQACRVHLAAPGPGAGRGRPGRRLAAVVETALGWAGPIGRAPGMDRLRAILGRGRSGAPPVRREAVEALDEGVAMGLARIDELLLSHGVQAMDCLERSFDPERMIAVDVVDVEAGADGRVIEVYRQGYERLGRVVRPARVRVARRRRRLNRNQPPKPAKEEEGDG